MRLIAITTAAALVATSAFADGPICERDISIPGVDTASLTFYAHGCDRFQYQPLTAAQVLNLGEHCSVESYASGGTEEETVVDQVEYGATQPGDFDRDNLTSMGMATSNGQQVMRVRSATDGNPVSIRRAGGGVVWSGTVGAGDTFVQVGGSGTYIATTGSRTITKATGSHSFTDRTETTVTVEREGGDFYQPGPRTSRCGFPGEAIN
jgi:hypothetical protein